MVVLAVAVSVGAAGAGLAGAAGAWAGVTTGGGRSRAVGGIIGAAGGAALDRGGKPYRGTINIF